MSFPARPLALLAGAFLFAACHSRRPQPAPPPVARPEPAPSLQPAPVSPLAADAVLPSRNLIVGRVIAVDRARGFAFVEVAAGAPAAALVEGAELVTRTDALRETAHLTASRYGRDRTLGTRIASGQPAPGDEVVFPAP